MKYPQEIHKNLYRLDVSFTDHSLSGINPYLIKGLPGERNLLIETALDSDDCYGQLMDQMKQLGAGRDNTDVIVSHMHVDHCGLIGRLKSGSNRIYAEEHDAAFIRNYQKPVKEWGWLAENICWTGTPPDAAVPLNEHVAVKYYPKKPVELTPLKLGEKLQYGGYCLELIDLSGHAAAQIGLWCEDRKMLFAGDHLLADHNPNITVWNLEEDYAERYLRNLAKLAVMDIQHFYPAHGEELADVRGRAEQYLQKLEQKAGRVLEILAAASKPVTACEVAGNMYSREKFDRMKAGTRWFVCSDVLAYLQHLRFTGQAQVTLKEGCCFYSDKKG